MFLHLILSIGCGVEVGDRLCVMITEEEQSKLGNGEDTICLTGDLWLVIRLLSLVESERQNLRGKEEEA